MSNFEPYSGESLSEGMNRGASGMSVGLTDMFTGY